MKTYFFRITLLLLFGTALVTGCKEDDPIDVNKEAPVVTLSSAQTTGMIGSQVGTTVSITGSAGLSKLIIYKDNASLEEIPLTTGRTATHNFNYTLESGLQTGTIINFSFEALDSLNNKSEKKVLVVTVAETPEKVTVQVSGEITADTVFTNDKIWRLNGLVRIMSGANLTIQPGTLILGAKDSQGTLIIERGAKIIADGNAQNPIVFTSEVAAGSRVAGDWGGVVICGKAPNNQGNTVALEGGYQALYGGTVSNDNSGILRYVRIEFAGKVYSSNAETNSLTLAGVGNGTIIENVQCSYGLDDSFQFFGGTVNAKNLVSYKTRDDDFDVENGHAGFIQFAFALRDANLGDNSYSNGLEIDNDGAGMPSTPFTQTVFSNVTIIGAKYSAENVILPHHKYAAHFRRNSKPTLYNSFLTGFPVGIYMDDEKPGVSASALINDLQVRNVILAGVDSWGNNGWGGSTLNNNNSLLNTGTPAIGFEVNTWFNTTLYNNTVLSKWQDAGIDQNIHTSLTPKLTPNTGSMLLTAAKWDNTPKAGAFFTQVTYAGAFGTTDWTAGWCEWDPNNKVY